MTVESPKRKYFLRIAVFHGTLQFGFHCPIFHVDLGYGKNNTLGWG